MSTATTDRPETDDMVLVHRVFRREFRLLPALVRGAAPGDTQRREQVAAHAAELTTTLHHHHTGEDDLVWPRLLERTALDAALVQRMQDQHERVAGLLHTVDELLPRWRRGEHVAEHLATALEQVSAALEEHLDEEERSILPLVQQHLSVQEWAELGERGMAAMPKPRLLVFLGHILEEASPQERTAFFRQVPLPARVLYRLVGERGYRRETAALRAGIPAQRA